MNATKQIAIDFAKDFANNDYHGYDQINRLGRDGDCSSIVIRAWGAAGVIAAKIRSESTTGFEIIIGGSAISGISVNWVAFAT
jgi:hypothetical protein